VYEYRLRHHHDPGRAIRTDPTRGAQADSSATKDTICGANLVCSGDPEARTTHSTNIVTLDTPATDANSRFRFNAETTVPNAGGPTRTRRYPVSIAKSISAFLRPEELTNRPRKALGPRLKAWPSPTEPRFRSHKLLPTSTAAQSPAADSS